MWYELLDKRTGEIIEANVLLIGKKPTKVDRGFVKVFIAFLEDLIEDKEISGKAVRLLLYMLKNLNHNTLEVYINPKEAMEDLQISNFTFYTWLKQLQEKGIIEKKATNLFKLKPYTAIKGDTSKTIEKEIERRERTRRKTKR